MKNFFTLWFVILLLCLLPGCGFLYAGPPMTCMERTVTPVVNGQKEVVFNQPMIFYDLQKTRGIRFPAGVYSLEAEDRHYYYFAAPSEIEYRVFEGDKVVDGRSIPGGLCLGKTVFKMPPAGAYMNSDEKDPKKRYITWKMGSEFLTLEGAQWKRNY